MMVNHELQVGDTVRVTNVASHMYGEEYFNEGDTAVVVNAEPFLGIIPSVFLRPTKAGGEPGFHILGVPFAGDDLKMLTKIER